MRVRLSPELLAIVAAVVFVLLGVLGFVPGITSHHDQLHVWKTGSRAQLFGVFEVSVLLNALHLAFGLLGFPAARTPVGARLYLICGAIGYFALTVYGVAIEHRSRANVLPLDRADNGLHAGLALGLLALAWIGAHLHQQPAAAAEEKSPPPSSVSGEREALEGLEGGLEQGRRAELLPAVAWLSGREVHLDEDELHGARRRAVLLLAAGGDPLRGLDLDGRAVRALAAELDDPARREELRLGLQRLRGEAEGLPAVCEALSALLEDLDLAWRAFACGHLAEELGE